MPLVEAGDKADEYNDACYALRIRHGQTRILLPGDVGEKGWNDMLDAGVNISADILVASHHGRKSGYSARALKAINPTAVIISTAKLDPGLNAEDDYKTYTGGEVYSTRVHGTIWARMYDNGSFELHSHDGELAGWTRKSAA